MSSVEWLTALSTIKGQSFVMFRLPSRLGGTRPPGCTHCCDSKSSEQPGLPATCPQCFATRGGRAVYLVEELKDVFIQQWESRKKTGKLDPHVFLARNVKDMVKSFRKAWKKDCQGAGIGKRLFHNSRRLQ